jgi:hypothetical protein
VNRCTQKHSQRLLATIEEEPFGCPQRIPPDTTSAVIQEGHRRGCLSSQLGEFSCTGRSRLTDVQARLQHFGPVSQQRHSN